MTTPLIILGAGGFGREVHDVIESINDAQGDDVWELLGFVDNHVENPELLRERGAPLLGGDEVLATLPKGTRFVIAIGDGRIRRALDEKATALGLMSAVLVHPTAWIGRHLVTLAPGAIVCAHVSITTNAQIGRHSHINLNSTVGHDARLRDYVTVNPGATLSGNVTLEDEVTIGTGASVIPGITIGAASVIGAGAAVVRDIPPGVTAVGIPAKVLGT